MGHNFTKDPCLVASDSTGALNNALKLVGSKLQLLAARELAWRKAKFEWNFAVGHVPAEANELPDALSRKWAPSPVLIPWRQLDDASEVNPPDVSGIWKCV